MKLTLKILLVLLSNNFFGNEINKFLIFEELWGDTTLQNANDTLSDFFDKEGSTNLGILHNAEQALAIRDFTTANSLINSLSTESNIEYCYKRFLQFCYNYFNDGVLNENDQYSLEILAAQCPFTDGPSIYKARTLLNTITNDIIIYNDDECKGEGYSNRMANNPNLQNTIEFFSELKRNEEQQNLKRKSKTGLSNNVTYQIFPSPSNGLIYIRSWKSSETMDVKVSDVTGRILFHKLLATNEFITSFNCDLKNGVYLIYLKNSSNEIFSSKIILHK